VNKKALCIMNCLKLLPLTLLFLPTSAYAEIWDPLTGNQFFQAYLGDDLPFYSSHAINGDMAVLIASTDPESISAPSGLLVLNLKTKKTYNVFGTDGLPLRWLPYTNNGEANPDCFQSRLSGEIFCPSVNSFQVENGNDLKVSLVGHKVFLSFEYRLIWNTSKNSFTATKTKVLRAGD